MDALSSVNGAANVYMARQAQNVQASVQMSMLSKSMDQGEGGLMKLINSAAQSAEEMQSMYFSATGVGGSFDAQA